MPMSVPDWVAISSPPNCQWLGASPGAVPSIGGGSNWGLPLNPACRAVRHLWSARKSGAGRVLGLGHGDGSSGGLQSHDGHVLVDRFIVAGVHLKGFMPDTGCSAIFGAKPVPRAPHRRVPSSRIARVRLERIERPPVLHDDTLSRFAVAGVAQQTLGRVSF